MALSRTARFYRANPDSRKHHVEHQAQINKKPSEVKKRVELNAYNRKHPSKKDDDASHKYDKATHKMKIVGFSKASRNRGDKNNAPGDRRARGGKK